MYNTIAYYSIIFPIIVEMSVLGNLFTLVAVLQQQVSIYNMVKKAIVFTNYYGIFSMWVFVYINYKRVICLH